MKKSFKIILIILVVVALTSILCSCSPNNKKYFEQVSSYSFWDNKGNEAIPQYQAYKIMDKWLSEGTINNGQSVDADGKVRKVLFLGWDGVRADALTNIFYDANNFATNNYNYQSETFSGLHELKNKGGLYLAYAGGEKGQDSEQSSSTCAGWTSELTGGWNTLHGVKENSDVKNASADTLMLKYAKLGLNTGFAFDWGQYFDVTLRNEVKYLIDNPTTPMTLCDIDRTKATSNADILKNEELKKEKDINAVDLEHYNKVASENIHQYAKYDIAMRDYLTERINNNDDIVAGVFHRPDTNGHTTGFENGNPDYVNSVRNADIYLYELLKIVNERELNNNEKWLVITTADHGGSGTGHGQQVYEHRTIWMACNIEIESQYYGKNYNGLKEN